MNISEESLFKLFQAHPWHGVTRGAMHPRRSTRTLKYGHIKDIKQCPKALVERLKHYFLSYKQLPGDAPRRVEIVDVYDRAVALDVIRRSINDYKAQVLKS